MSHHLSLTRARGSCRARSAAVSLILALAGLSSLPQSPALARPDGGESQGAQNLAPHFPDPMPPGQTASIQRGPSGPALDPRFLAPQPPQPACSDAKPKAPDQHGVPLAPHRGGGTSKSCTNPGQQRSSEADQGVHGGAGGAGGGGGSPPKSMTPGSNTAPTAAEFRPSGSLPTTPGGGGTTSPDWVQQTPLSSPPARWGHGMTYDAARNRTVIFGGVSAATTLLADTWTWAGTGWTQMLPATSPSPRHYPQMAYDPAIGKTILFGGSINFDAAYNDTWALDGATWTQLSPAVSPPARSGGQMEYDPAIGKLVIFGGRNNGGSDDLNDTWTFDGTNWAQLSPATVPAKRDGAGPAFDTATNTLVMFGGNTCGAPCSAFSEIGDTWTFDGSNWTQKAPSTSPGSRDQPGMAYDADLQRVVLFGGDVDVSGTTTYLNDTWLWDGATWTQATGIASPPGRSDMVMAYNPRIGQIVMFGGQAGPPPTYGDTWTYNTAVPTVTKAVDRAGPSPVYPRGGQVGYTVTVGNPGTVPMSNVSLQDTMPPSLLAGGAPIQVNGAACSGGVICSVSGQSLSVQGLTIPSQGSVTVTYSVIALGADRQCSIVQNSAQAANRFGNSAVGQIPITVCDVGLGLENWWSYVTRGAGPMAVARLNAANGNMVLQQDDFTQVQAHGHLGFGLRRTYNSEDSTLLTLPGSIGAGWTFNVSEAGDLAGDGVRADGLYVPSLEALASPLAVTLIDQTGSHHVFQPKGLSAVIDITALQGSQNPGALGDLIPKVLQLGAGNVRLCVDQTYSAPPGVHLGLWRYIETSGSSCAGMTPANSLLLGFVAERPDRLRSEFSWDGHLLDMQDGAGNEIRYTYAGAPAAGANLGNIQSITEPVTGRGYTFSYPSGSEADVVDPGGRIAHYTFDGGPFTSHLKEVATFARDGSTRVSDVKYTYGGCGGTANQMCSATDPRGDNTTFTYRTTYSDGSTQLLGLPKLASLTDRRGTGTSLSYSLSPDTLTADEAGQRRLFQGIDSSGRVGEIDAGDTSGTVLNQTLNTWDTAGGTTCRQPDNAVDNHLCSTTRKSLSGGTPDEVSSYLYNPEGAMLRQRQLNPGANLDSTYGYHAQYIQADGSVRCFDDAVAGSGAVSSAAVSTPAPCVTGTRGDGGTLFTVSDRTQALAPRGNAAGGGFGPYLTALRVDDNAALSPNARPAGTVCTNPAVPSANTGSLCEKGEPSFDGTHPTVTRYTYDPYGQKATMTTPKAIAEGGGTYTYSYYPDPSQSADNTQTKDLSGSTAQGGWLKGVTDPVTNFVAFAYDAAGNVTRKWDRDATQGKTLDQFPGTRASAPSGTYTEELHGTGSLAYSSPWRYLLSSRDQLGNLTTNSVDSNGNTTSVRPPRGNAAGNSSYDTTQIFDANDNLTSKLNPAEASANKPTTYSYDAFDNRASMTDPKGNTATVTYQHDSVNRLTVTSSTRGPWPSDTTQVPPACRQSTSADAPIVSGRILCSSSLAYDGVDNRTSASDGNAQRTDYTFDGVHRETSHQGPRQVGSIRTRTDTVYDADGHVLDTCPAREFTEGSRICTHTAFYSQHQDYDVAGRVADSYTYRSADASTQNLTAVSHDADGNVVSTTDPNAHTTTTAYDVLDRKVSQSVPRDASTSYTTGWIYDPAGNLTSVVQPGNLDVGSGSDGGLVVDGSQYPQSSPYYMIDSKNFTSLTLQNGGWIAMPPAGTLGSLQIHVVGTVSVCATCGITASAAGPDGGLGATSATGSGQSGAGSGGGGGAGSGAATGGGGGGAGHNAGGTAGTSNGAGAGTPGSGGSSYGRSDLSDAGNGTTGMGSGGGGGGDGSNQHGGLGGPGGGFLHITATTISDLGSISSDGGRGHDGIVPVSGVALGGGGGGGGSGGSVWLTAQSATLAGAGAVTTAGGGGGGGAGGNNGGTGDKGRVRIDADQLTGAGAGGNPSWGSFNRGYVGRMTAYGYDADNRLVDTVKGADNPIAASAGVASGDGGANVRTRQAYDADGHLAAQFDPRAFSGSVTNPDASYMARTDFDQDGRPSAQYVPRYDGNAHSDLGLSSAQNGQCPTGASPQSVGGVPAYPSGVGVCVTRAQYDYAGNMSRLTLPTSSGSDNRYVARAYTDDNHLLNVDAPSPDPSSGSRVAAAAYLYDGVGQPVKVTYPLGRQQITTYYPDELVQQVSNLSTSASPPVTSYELDGNGNPTRVTDQVGNQTNTSYFADDRKSAVVAGANDGTVANRTSYVYDRAGNPTQVFSPSANAADANNTANTPTVNGYTFDNLALSTTTPFTPDGTQRRQTTYGYDRGGRKTSQHTVLANYSAGGAGGGFSGVSQDGGTQSFGYFNDDRQSSQTGRDGKSITTQYDPAGNRTSIADNSVGTVTLSASYYLDSLPRAVDDGARTSQYGYDGAGQPSVRADAVDNSSTRYLTNYAYGDAELPTNMSADVLSGAQTRWTYDQAGRPTLERQLDASGNNLREQTSKSYNGDDTLYSKTLTSAGGANLATWGYSYDGARRVTDQSYSGAGGNHDPFHFTYDAAGRLKQWTYGSSTVPLSWDHDGNRTRFGNAAPYNTVATYNADNSIRTLDDGSGAGAQSYSYAAFGGLSDDRCHNYSYDGFDRLYQVSAGARCSGTTITYGYDGLDRQRSRGETDEVRLHYDGLGSQVGVETSVNSGIDTAYELSPAGARMAVTVKPQAPTAQEYLADDGHGNITNATTTLAGATCSARLDPFGGPISPQSATNPCNTGSTPNTAFFKGGRRDGTTGDYQMGSRTYDPAKAAFLTPDSYRADSSAKNLGIGTDPLTQNRYAALNGDPINLSDPSGHDSCSLWNPSSWGQCGQDAVNTVLDDAQKAEAAAAEAARQAAAAAAEEARRIAEAARQAEAAAAEAERKAQAALAEANRKARVIDEGLHKLPGAVVADVAEVIQHPEVGQQNFITNFTNGGWIAVGLPLVAAASIAIGGIALELGVGGLVVGGVNAARGAIVAGAAKLTNLVSRDAPAAEQTNPPGTLYHYSSKNPAQVFQEGLSVGRSGNTYLTPSGNLSDVQAQIELGLPGGRGYPSSLWGVNTQDLLDQGLQLTGPRRVTMLPGGGAGGGWEVLANGPIPPNLLTRLW